VNLTSADLIDLADIAIRAATEAGQMIAQSRPRDVRRKDAGQQSVGQQSVGPQNVGQQSVGQQSVGPQSVGGASLASQLVTEVDRQSEDLILEILNPTLERFELGLLTEEQSDDGSRLSAEYFWCIDPLDGTLPFIEGVPGYAVSIALIARDGTPHVGVVHDPVQGTLLHAISGRGAFRDGAPWSLGSRRKDVLSVFADRSFLARGDHDVLVGELGEIAQQLGLAGVRLDGTRGAVMNACEVLAHPSACYFKFPKETGGGSLWDFAATACLFREVGAVATNIHGGPLDLNRVDATNMAHQGVLFATDQLLASHLRTLWSD